jgi:signal transduction histidine kinase
MTTLATLIVVSAGVYAFVAAHWSGLWWMRRSSREHGAFALLSAGLALFALGAAITADARDVASAALGQRVQFSAGLLTLGPLVSFCYAVSQEPAPRIERAAWAFAVVTGAIGAAGLFIDPAFASASFDGAAPAAGGRPLAALLPAAWATLPGAALFATVGLLHLARRALVDRTLRPTLAACCVLMTAGAWDLVVVSSGADLPLLSAVLPVGAALVVSWALIGRFAAIDAQLASRTEELAGSYEALRQAQQQLVRKEQLAAVGELSAVIAHEVRNPLAIVRNAVTGLRRAEGSASDTETLLAIIDEEADRLNRLVSDLLTYARPVIPESRAVDVGELVERAVAIAREGQPHRANIRFALRTGVPLPPVEGDPALLRHALINIVDNAIQAMPPEGGIVAITCRACELDARAGIAIDFHDEGEGMDTLVRSKARDPFFTTRRSGTGLGLAIVDRVARVHGGRVEIESRRGAGTTVTLLLPCERSSLTPPATFS